MSGSLDAHSLDQRPDTPYIYAPEFGVRANGVTDDFAALEDAVGTLGTSVAQGAAGGVLQLGRGTYMFSQQLNIPIGVRVEGVTNFASVLKPLAGFDGESDDETLPAVLRFKKTGAATQDEAIGARNLRIDMNGIDGNGITCMKAYDWVSFENVYVRNVADTSNAFRIIPDPDEANKVSQTIVFSNCGGIHKNATATAATWYFDNVHEVTLLNCKGWGGPNTSTASVPFHFLDCRGVNFIGGAAALSANEAFKITTSTKSSKGLFFYSPTLESVGKYMVATGSSGEEIDDIYWTPARKEQTVTGGFELSYVRGSEIHSRNQSVSLDANCSQNIIHTDLYSLVTNSGTDNTIISKANAVDRESRINRLNIGVMKVAGGVSVIGYLGGSKTWDPADTADGAIDSTTVTVTGAAIGNLCTAGFSNAVPAGAVLTASVTATDTVTVTLFNKTGGNLNLASGTLKVGVWQQ